ncbi:MAG: hypothetical protein KGV43_02930 [Arcobacter sp.]|nr:hypothetical protein [Arcobacter sp.]
MKSKSIFISLFISFLFTGCLIEYPESYKLKYLQSTKITDLKYLTKDLLIKMEAEILAVIPRVNKHVYVTDFVNLKNLELTSQLGFLLSSEVKTHIIKRYHIPIKELEYSKYIQMGKKGTKVLTRDLDDINTKEIKKTFAFVGTYSITQRQLILHLKLINMKTGNILGMSSSHTRLTDEIIKLEKKENKPIIRPHVVL